MSEAPSIQKLRDTTGISQSYASMILNGARDPSRGLAIRIFRDTGWRHSSIASLSADQIALLETVDPWTPRPSEQSSAAVL